MKRRDLPSAEELKSAFSYDPETGRLTWLPRPVRQSMARTDKAWNSQRAGTVAGTLTKAGHLRVDYYARALMAHRIIWKMAHGTEPLIIDHINRNGSDNRLLNLRASDSRLNVANSKIRSDNISGLKGANQRVSRRNKLRWKAVFNRNIGNLRHGRRGARSVLQGCKSGLWKSFQRGLGISLAI
jgi:hypothetical protein